MSRLLRDPERRADLLPRHSVGACDVRVSARLEFQGSSDLGAAGERIDGRLALGESVKDEGFNGVFHGRRHASTVVDVRGTVNNG